MLSVLLKKKIRSATGPIRLLLKRGGQSSPLTMPLTGTREMMDY